MAIESAILEVTGVDEHQVAVTGVPDPKHGERLCVLYTDLGMSPAEVHQRLMAGPTAQALDPLGPRFHPRRRRSRSPGTGKVDLGPSGVSRPVDPRPARTRPRLMCGSHRRTRRIVPARITDAGGVVDVAIGSSPRLSDAISADEGLFHGGSV